MNRIEKKTNQRRRRKMHIRKRIKGTASIPRMTVFKSNKHMYVQVIDDDKMHTLASVSSLESEMKALRNCIEDGGKLGEEIGKRLKKIKISKVVFDRNGYLYHGIVKAIADGARKAGIVF
jgi:large subunit ribosomal protein L18